MKILFTFENCLPSREADAEVFVTTASCLAPMLTEAWLHVPVESGAAVPAIAGVTAIRAWAPARPAALRHFFCGLTLVLRRDFYRADLIYTRNLWIAWIAVLLRRQVVFDHYRPWSDQIPPLQLWIYRLFCNRRLLVNICHSDYTRDAYQALGIPAEKLRRVHNGFAPARLGDRLALDEAKQRIGVAAGQKTVVYTGRVNHKKGLALVVEAARALPDLLFLLVGSVGDGPIEAMARDVANIRMVPWQRAETLSDYIAAADILLIPPSWQPLAAFGSTVLPLKLFLYLASGRPILAGDTPDVREVLAHNRNAVLCEPDKVAALINGITGLIDDPARAARLAAAAEADSRDFTWDARAQRIMAIMTERLAASGAGPGVWGPAQSRFWRRQSRRWLVNLVRRRSWILPPDIAPAAPPP